MTSLGFDCLSVLLQRRTRWRFIPWRSRRPRHRRSHCAASGATRSCPQPQWRLAPPSASSSHNPYCCCCFSSLQIRSSSFDRLCAADTAWEGTDWANSIIPATNTLSCSSSVLLSAVYRGGPKNVALSFCPYLRHLLTDFQNSFTGTLCGQFAIMWLLYIPPHHKYVSALPHKLSATSLWTTV